MVENEDQSHTEKEMKKRHLQPTVQPRGAVIYLRVSTDDQATNIQNLPNQERMCREGWKGKGEILCQFLDAGESARTADRSEFQRMISYCHAHRHEVGYVIVENLSRFARNVADQAQAISSLLECGVRVRSIAEPNVDETAAGRLAANIHGSFNQYFSDMLSEKMKVRCRAAVEAGRWPWQAPPGYVNVNTAKEGGANIAPDPQASPLLCKAFEMIASGLHTQAEVLKTVTGEGLRNRRGRPFIPQEFHRILRNPVYCGWIAPKSMPDLRVKGLHRPIVSQELFDQVQDVLDGKKPVAAPRRKVNPDFPLKNFIRCGVCATPLTACMARSKNSKLYPYYYCRKPGCRAVKSIAKQEMEASFENLLGRLRPAPEVNAEFPKVAGEVWREQQGNAEKQKRKLSAALEEQKKLKSELLRAKLRGEVAQADYEQVNAEFTREIADIERGLREIDAAQADGEAFLRFAQLQLMDIGGAWRLANPEQRVRVRNLLFQNGLSYFPDSGISNTCNSSLYSLLEAITADNIGMARPERFELPTYSSGGCRSIQLSYGRV